ncbi:MAG: immune inhibitor A [Actinomycetota bacterium]|nr:immune inhibitor A [Actinomycetota bacterium]
MKRIASAALVATVLCALVAFPGASASGAANRTTDNIPYDISAQLKHFDPPSQEPTIADLAALDIPADILAEHGDPDLVLELFDWSADHAGPHSVPFWKESSGTTHSDVYVGWADLEAPATSSQQDQTITPDQIQYMADEFDARIWESDVFHFGNYMPRASGPGMDGSRAAIMVYNIRDDAYWTSYRFYVAGYFWGGLNDDLGINAVFVDSFNWADRTGSDSARPYLYEGTLAHEFEHLIHNDVDGNEDSFLDEGMADMAEQFLYGTQATGGHIGEYLYYHRDSLTDWDGELYDYGNAVLWQDYLWEHAGGGALGAPLAGRVAPGYEANMFDETDDKFADSGDAFIWNLIHNQTNGLASIGELVGGMPEVEQLHRDYTLANLLDGKVGQSQWNYRNLALGGADSDYYTIDDGIAFYQSNVNGNMPPTRKNVRRRTGVESWGAYYRTFGGAEPGVTMAFTGSATDGVTPHSAPSEWYAGLGNNLQRGLSREFTDVAPGSQLSFWTWYDIEQDWDYGYIEGSADGTNWAKLAQISALPAGGATNIYGSSAWDGPGGLTGNSGGWQQATFDLGGLSGDVFVRFRYATDEAVNGLGWYVDDVSAGGESDAVTDATRPLWTDGGWMFTNGMQDNDWTCDAYVPYVKAKWPWFTLTPVVPSAGVGVTGSIWIPTQYLKNNKIYGIVSNRPSGSFESVGRLTVQKSK